MARTAKQPCIKAAWHVQCIGALFSAPVASSVDHCLLRETATYSGGLRGKRCHFQAAETPSRGIVRCRNRGVARVKWPTLFPDTVNIVICKVKSCDYNKSEQIYQESFIKEIQSQLSHFIIRTKLADSIEVNQRLASLTWRLSRESLSTLYGPLLPWKHP